MSSENREYLLQDRTLKFLDKALWLRLGNMLRGYKLAVALAFGCVIISEILPQFLPRLVMQMIDGPVVRKDMDALLPYSLIFLVLVIISGMFRYCSAVISQTVALKIIHQMRTDLFQKVQQYKMGFFKRTPVGRLMTRLTNDIDAINTMFADGFIDLASAFLMLIFPIGFMLHLNWKLCLITLSFTPIMLFATSLFRVKVREINKKIRKTLARLNTEMQESLSGNYILRIFGKSAQQWNEFDEVNSSLRKKWMTNTFYYAVYFPVIGGLTEIAIVVMYFAGAYLFFRDQASIGMLVAFSWYMGMFWRPMREISEKYTQLQTALAAAERVFTLFDIDPTIPSGTAESSGERTSFSFQKVHFSYRQGHEVLKDISFTLEEGETLAVVGATGSGKSTLLSLCSRFYLPDSGTIRLSGRPLGDYSEGFLRAQMGFIPQDVYLFAESIAFNIALSDDVDREKMLRVSRYVNAHHFIEKMDKQYDAPVRERGENLSLGQRQLLAFARALYHEPGILLLDEATSAIDTETEELVQDAMKKLTTEMTSIVVAHRLSTIRSADRILVMHKGEIREQGTHRQLLNQNGIYKKLYELQGYEREAR